MAADITSEALADQLLQTALDTFLAAQQQPEPRRSAMFLESTAAAVTSISMGARMEWVAKMGEPREDRDWD